MCERYIVSSLYANTPAVFEYGLPNISVTHSLTSGSGPVK